MNETTAGVPIIADATLRKFPGTAIFNLIVEDCPYCHGRHIHSDQEGARDSPCKASVDGLIVQGGKYIIKRVEEV